MRVLGGWGAGRMHDTSELGDRRVRVRRRVSYGRWQGSSAARHCVCVGAVLCYGVRWGGGIR
jgi:hypothetical protein